MLQSFDPTVLGALLAGGLFLGILLSLRVGRALGMRAIAREGRDDVPSIGSLEAAIFALLGLLIAFTFSGALERFDKRRAQVVDEANAIGTAWLRVGLLPDAVQPPLRETFRRYVDSRIDTYRKLPDIDAAREEHARSQRLQTELWAQALAGVRAPDSRPAAEMLLMPALNEMFDIASVRIAATQMHPPPIVYAMLIALALAAGILAGYQSANARGFVWIYKLGFAAIVAFTVYVILDIEYPRVGWVRIDAIDQVLITVRAGMN